MIKLNKNTIIKNKQNITKKKSIKSLYTNTIKKKLKTNKIKKDKKYKNIKTQYGKGILKSLSGEIFTNMGVKQSKTNIIGSKFLNSSKKSIKSLQSDKKKNDLLNIFYAYKTPYQININKSSLNTIYQSSKLATAPHIHIDNHNSFLFVIILPALNTESKPKLLWAINFKSRVQYNKVITYSLPKLPINTNFKLIFKLYRYPDHINNFFSIKNSMVIKRGKALRKLNKYLIKKNMLNNIVEKYSISVRQDKDGISNDFFKL